MEKNTPQLTGQKWQILSGTAIKMIGITLMAVSHLYEMFIAQGAPPWLNWLGRPVAAMFLFLCAEGFYHTRNKKGYLLRLLIGFLGMALINRVLTFYMPLEDVALINNIFGTLFLAAFYMWMTDLIREGAREKNPGKIIRAAGAMLIPFLIGAAILLSLNSGNHTLMLILTFIPSIISVEGGAPLVFLGLLFYITRNRRYIQAALVAVMSVLAWITVGGAEWLILGAVIPILLYNGSRGREIKYFFYIFYPAHIYLFYIIAWFIRV
jgi:hypothetical protein